MISTKLFQFRLLQLLVAFFLYGQVVLAQTTPLAQAHSHNDYEQERPLREALERGFTSIEADVLFIYGKLYVGHNMPDTKRHRLKTLTRQYLKPLYRHFKRNQGNIFPGYTGQFYLWIDIKFEARQSYQRLREVLLPFREMLSYHENGHFHPGKVTVILSGDRPFEQLLQDSLQLMTLDGRPDDLAKNYPSALMPFISQNFYVIAGLSEDRPAYTQAARERVRQFVGAVHEQGKRARLWATPEKEELWWELLSYGVDLLNTDDLARLQQFLRPKKQD